MTRIRGGRRKRWHARIGAPDAALTANGGLAAVSELCDRLGVIKAIDAAAGPIKQRNRGYSAGELLAGIAAAQLAGEDFLMSSGGLPIGQTRAWWPLAGEHLKTPDAESCCETVPLPAGRKS